MLGCQRSVPWLVEGGGGEGLPRRMGPRLAPPPLENCCHRAMVYEEKTVEYVMFWVVSKAQDCRGPAPGLEKDPEGLL